MARKRIQVKKKAKAKRGSRRDSPPPAETGHAPQDFLDVEAPDLVTPHGQGVPDQIIDELIATRVWVIVASVLAFVGTATALIFMIMALRAAFGGEESETMTTDQALKLVVAAVWLVGVIVALTIAIRMVLFANRIGFLEKYRSEQDLEYVLAHVRGFWAMVGGGMLILILVGAVQAGIRFFR